ncbi:Scn2a [Symbiodinium necroappetens]|uniref:Scn2a protein n=1 Tax=Symbiodinium necroappetens TaxID=1628268 RepID=A0A812IQC0_9DINO|nr:Scn2a [Symbiodinium necroappetens]
MQTSMLPMSEKETAGADLEDATAIVKLLKAAGFSAAAILELGHSAAALRLAGYDVSELRALGLDTKGLREAGYSAKALQASGCTAPELKDAGYSPAELKDLGFTAYELRLLSFQAEQMRKSQFSAHQLLTGGYSSAQLKEGGYTAQELLSAGRTPAELREMGTGVAELRKAGVGVKEIKEAGFTYVDMMIGGFCPDEVLLQVHIPYSEMGHAVAHLFSASGATAQSRHDVTDGKGKPEWEMILLQEACFQQPTYFRSFTQAAMAAALQLVLVACAFQDGFADIDNIFPILYASNPVAQHTACPTPAGQATVCQLSGYEEGGRDLQYLITSLPSSGALYETSQNYRTYGTDPKYAATSIKDFELPFKVTDALGRVVYIPPSDVFPPEGRWAAMTYEVQEPAGGNKSQPGQVSFSSPSQQVAASTFVGGTDAWTISGNIYATVPTWQAFGWGMLNRYLYGTDEVQYIDFDTNSDKSKWYFEAPPGKFYLPELAASYGGTLQFTIASTYGDFQHLNSPLDFITLECASCNSDRGMRLVRFADNGLEWTGEEKIVQVTLSTGNHWWRDPMNAALPFTDATECEIAAVGKQNVLQPSRQPPDPTSELLESIQSVLRQQELQIQELLAEQTESGLTGSKKDRHLAKQLATEAHVEHAKGMLLDNDVDSISTKDLEKAAIKRMDTLVGLREMPAEFANHVSDFVAGVTQLDRRTRQSDSNFSGEGRRGGEAKTGDGDEVDSWLEVPGLGLDVACTCCRPLLWFTEYHDRATFDKAFSAASLPRQAAAAVRSHGNFYDPPVFDKVMAHLDEDLSDDVSATSRLVESLPQLRSAMRSAEMETLLPTALGKWSMQKWFPEPGPSAKREKDVKLLTRVKELLQVQNMLAFDLTAFLGLDEWQEYQATIEVVASAKADVSFAFVLNEHRGIPKEFDRPWPCLTFTVLFTLELLLRLRTEGRGMFSCHNPDIKWNVMDTVLVMLGILDEVMTRTFAAMRDAHNSQLSGLLRLVRVARVLRVLRFFSDLRVMIMGVLSSLKALMWALILLFFIIYITAVCILQFVGEYLADNPQDFPSGPLEFVGLSPFSSLR